MVAGLTKQSYRESKMMAQIPALRLHFIIKCGKGERKTHRPYLVRVDETDLASSCLDVCE
jgi:hypothetical protein